MKCGIYCNVMPNVCVRYKLCIVSITIFILTAIIFWNFALEEEFNIHKGQENVEGIDAAEWFDPKRSGELKCLLSDCGKMLQKHERSLLADATRDAGMNIFSRYFFSPDMAGYTRDAAGALVCLGHKSSKLITRTVVEYEAQPPVILSTRQMMKLQPVHIMVGVRGHRDRFIKFLHMIVNELFPEDPNFVLHVIYSATQSTHDDLGAESAKTLLHKILGARPTLKWTFEVEKKCSIKNRGYSRGCTFNIALKTLAPKDLVLLCDIDIIVRAGALQRCRTNALYKRKAFFPVVLSMFNPSGPYAENTNTTHSRCTNSSSTRAADPYCNDSGFWRDFGFGMACAYQFDIKRVGGFIETSGWGGEDVNLYEKFLSVYGIEVVRGPDPDLIHSYHPKQCRTTHHEDVRGSQHVSCLRSKVLMEGSEATLGVAALQTLSNLF